MSNWIVGKWAAATALASIARFFSNWKDVWAAYRSGATIPLLVTRGGTKLGSTPGSDAILLFWEIWRDRCYSAQGFYSPRPTETVIAPPGRDSSRFEPRAWHPGPLLRTGQYDAGSVAQEHQRPVAGRRAAHTPLSDQYTVAGSPRAVRSGAQTGACSRISSSGRVTRTPSLVNSTGISSFETPAS